MNNGELRKDPRKDNPMNNSIMVGVIVLLALGLGACSSGPSGSRSETNTNSAVTKAGSTPAAANGKTEKVPAVLMDAGEYGENIYDYAKANDWKKADVKVAALKEATKKVRTEVKNQSKNVDGLEADVAALDRAMMRLMERVFDLRDDLHQGPS